jgi:hypothetical protein
MASLAWCWRGVWKNTKYCLVTIQNLFFKNYRTRVVFCVHLYTADFKTSIGNQDLICPTIPLQGTALTGQTLPPPLPLNAHSWHMEESCCDIWTDVTSIIPYLLLSFSVSLSISPKALITPRGPQPENKEIFDFHVQCHSQAVRFGIIWKNN